MAHSPVTSKPTIAVIGGTGHLGFGLARLWAAAEYPVIIGSRAKAKAEAAAQALVNGHEPALVTGDQNALAARRASIIVLAVPYATHDEIVDEIKAEATGKIVIDTTVPLRPPKVSVVQLPPNGSPALAAQERLGSEVRVVSAFHNVGATKLQSGERADCDVLVFGNDQAARAVVIKLAEVVATRGIDGGLLANSSAAEALTSVLISINRRYNVPGAGIRITGLPPSDAQ